jgi:hypothetical protein
MTLLRRASTILFDCRLGCGKSLLSLLPALPCSIHSQASQLIFFHRFFAHHLKKNHWQAAAQKAFAILSLTWPNTPCRNTLPLFSKQSVTPYSHRAEENAINLKGLYIASAFSTLRCFPERGSGLSMRAHRSGAWFGQ